MCPRPYLWSCWHCQESKSMAHSIVMELPWASTSALPFSLHLSPKSSLLLHNSLVLTKSPPCVLFSVKFSSPVGRVWELLAESKGLLSQRIGKRGNDLQSEGLKSSQSHALIVKTSVAIFYTCLYWKNISVSFFIWREHKKNLILPHLQGVLAGEGRKVILP